MSSVTLYGIANCDSVKKARSALAQAGMHVDFHDFKKQGLSEALLQPWIEACGWETLVNRRGTTWRGLDAATQAAVLDAAGATRLLLAQPSVVKRPVIRWEDGTFTVGLEAASARLAAAPSR